MHDVCSFSVEGDITIIRFSRQPVIEENKAVLDELAHNYPQQLRLWDMRDIVIDQGQIELRDIARHAAETFTNDSRAAFVADDDLTFGTLRMFEVYSEQQSGQPRSRVFRSIEEAKDWLLAEKQQL